MKTTALLTLTLAGTLLALPTQAQQAPPAIRILPAPAQVDPPPDFDEPEMPDDGFIMPGFPGEMMMPPMPGRYTLLSANIQKDGKATPMVLRIDSQTGQVWQLKTLVRTRRHNGKIVTESYLSFVVVSEPNGGIRPGGGGLPGVGGGFVRPPPPTINVPPQPAPAPQPFSNPRPRR